MKAMAAELNLEEIHDTMVSVALEAATIILAAAPTDLDKGTKLNCKGYHSGILNALCLFVGHTC